MKKCTLIAAAIVAGSVSGVASASTVVFDDFSVDQTLGLLTPAGWGDPLGSGTYRVLFGENNISGGLWAPPVPGGLNYTTLGVQGAGVDLASYTGIYFDFVGAGTIGVSVGGGPPQAVNGAANTRVFLDFASIPGFDPTFRDIGLSIQAEGTTLTEFGLVQAAVIPLPGAAGMALAGMGLIGLRRRR